MEVISDLRMQRYCFFLKCQIFFEKKSVFLEKSSIIRGYVVICMNDYASRYAEKGAELLLRAGI